MTTDADDRDELDAALATLFRADAHEAIAVSYASVRAVHAAMGIESPGAARVAVAHDVDFDGTQFVVAASVAEPGARAEHDRVLVALMAGAAVATDVAADIVRHAPHATPELAWRAVRRVFDHARRSGNAATCNLLLTALPTQHGELRAWYAEQLAHVVIDTGGAHDVVERVTWIAVDELAASGAAHRAAGLAYEASRQLDSDAAASFEARAREIDPLGWGSRLGDVVDEDVRAAAAVDRRALRRALATGDARLESAALITIASAISEFGQPVTAISWHRRSMERALEANDWRLATMAGHNLAIALLNELDLVAARAHVDDMVRWSTRERLVNHHADVLLLAATVAAAEGDRMAIEAAVRSLDAHRTADADVPSWERAFRRAGLAEIFATIDPDAARAAWIEADELAARFSFYDQRLWLTVTECELFPERTTWQRLPELVGGGDSSVEARALCWLARYVALDGVEAARGTLAATIERVGAARTRLHALALSEAHAALACDWRALHRVADSWSEHGFTVDGALVAAGAASLAAAEAPDDARRWFDGAHHELARLGRTRELARLRSARARVVPSDTATGSDDDEPSSFVAMLDVDPEVERRLSALTVRRTIERKHQFPEGFACTIVRGVAAVDDGDPEQPFAFAVRGDTINLDAAILPGVVAPHVQVSALTTCVVDAIPLDVLAVEVARSGRVGAAVAARMYERARREVVRARELAAATAEERVAAVLLEMIDSVDDGALQPRLRVPRHVLGSLVGTTREWVTKCIATLVDEQVLGIDGQAILLLDRHELLSRATSRRHQGL